MTTENDDLHARIARLEEQHASYHSLLKKLTNRELVLRSAVLALIYHVPQGALSADFSMFLDQVVSEVPPPLQSPDLWKEVISAIEHDRKPDQAL
jgi:hypothetical protein